MIGTIIIAVLGYGLSLVLAALLPTVIIARTCFGYEKFDGGSFWRGVFCLLLAIGVAFMTRWLTGV